MVGLPNKVDLEYWYGDSFSGIEVRWENVLGEPQDLTGYLASMQIRDSQGVLVLHLDSDSFGGLQLVELEGKVQVVATPEQMIGGDLEEDGVYDYDLQVKSDFTLKTLLFGKFLVFAQVTQV